jgi:2-keto-4-pentenoate hydratase/2-oxohepta-3-ene-1,7-dioic acid hydratase in catechol pathway
MKMATYEHGGAEHVGVVDGDSVSKVDATVLELLAMTPEQRDAVARGDAVALADVRLCPPLQPPTIRDFVTFEQHVAGAVKNHGGEINPAWYDAPRFFWISPYSVVGPDDDVAVPPACEALDLELELAAVIGREGFNLSPAEARDHIAGYMVLNDWSARDTQLAEMPVGMGPSKGKDFATTIGPWIVTADELEPYRKGDRLDLRMTAWINGEQLGKGDTSASMAWSFEDLVAHASSGTWVKPGDVLGSGTAGDGCLLELWGHAGMHEPPPLRAGDEVTLEIEAIGRVSNRIVDGVAKIPVPPARRLP